MNAKELRVGNLIYNDFGEIQPVYRVDEKSILTKVEENGWSICFKPKPIQLTEEWLLIFGFKKRKNRHLFHWENKIVISEYKDEFENFFYPKTGYDIRFSNEIKYVHQLQNLYFALTGAELTVA